MHTWLINPAMVNELHLAYYREGQSELNAPERTKLVQDSCKAVPASRCFSDPSNPRLGITPGIPAKLGGVPYITLGGGFTIGNNIQGQVISRKVTRSSPGAEFPTSNYKTALPS